MSKIQLNLEDILAYYGKRFFSHTKKPPLCTQSRIEIPLWTERERCGNRLEKAIGKYDGEVRTLGRQTFFKHCHNCGQKMHILERHTVEPGGARHGMVNFWICQGCGEVERPVPPASAYGY